jgi:hypothetical protein
MLEGEMGEKILTMSPNRIPKAVLKAAGSPRSQATFTRLLEQMRKLNKKPTPKQLSWLKGLVLKAAQQAGYTPDHIDALTRMSPKELFQRGPTSVTRVYDIATKESSARRLLRWAFKGSKLQGIKWLGLGPTRNLQADLMSQVNELEQAAKSTLAEEVGAAKGKVGKGVAAVKGGAQRVGEAISPRGLTVAEEGTASALAKAGAKGMGKGARMLRAAGGVGTLLTVPLLAHEAYDSLVGKSKRARAALEASRRGGTASVSKELMFDILDKRADLQARRAMLARDPQLMQQIVTALGGQQAKVLTTSEAGFGVDTGPQGVPADEMDDMLDRLLGQMRGV